MTCTSKTRASTIRGFRVPFRRTSKRPSGAVAKTARSSIDGSRVLPSPARRRPGNIGARVQLRPAGYFPQTSHAPLQHAVKHVEDISTRPHVSSLQRSQGSQSGLAWRCRLWALGPEGNPTRFQGCYQPPNGLPDYDCPNDVSDAAHRQTGQWPWR